MADLKHETETAPVTQDAVSVEGLVDRVEKWAADLAKQKRLQSASHAGMIERGAAGCSPSARDAVADALTIAEAEKAEVARVAAVQARQSALVAAMPASPEWDALRAAMISRALDVLDAGQGAACDVLLEFVPEDEARRSFDEHFGWEEASNDPR